MPRDFNSPRDQKTPGKIDASVNNIPTSFGSGAGSLILQNISNAKHIRVSNRTQGQIAIHYRGKTTPSSPLIYIAAAPASGEVIEFYDDIEVGPNVYIRSDTGSAITTGVVTVSVW